MILIKRIVTKRDPFEKNQREREREIILGFESNPNDNNVGGGGGEIRNPRRRRGLMADLKEKKWEDEKGINERKNIEIYMSEGLLSDWPDDGIGRNESHPRETGWGGTRATEEKLPESASTMTKSTSSAPATPSRSFWSSSSSSSWSPTTTKNQKVLRKNNVVLLQIDRPSWEIITILKIIV